MTFYDVLEIQSLRLLDPDLAATNTVNDFQAPRSRQRRTARLRRGWRQRQVTWLRETSPTPSRHLLPSSPNLQGPGNVAYRSRQGQNSSFYVRRNYFVPTSFTLNYASPNVVQLELIFPSSTGFIFLQIPWQSRIWWVQNRKKTKCNARRPITINMSDIRVQT